MRRLTAEIGDVHDAGSIDNRPRLQSAVRNSQQGNSTLRGDGLDCGRLSQPADEKRQ